MSGFRRAQLGACCEIVSGATPDTGTADYWGGDVCWATPKDLSNLDGHYISDTPRKLTPLGLGSCSASILPPHSVLFSSRAPIGHVAINTVPMATNQGFKSFVPGPEVDAKFLFHWLRAHRSYLEGLGVGATFKEVSKAVVSKVEIPLPHITEQRRIAAILDKADALRAKRREAFAQLDRLAQSIFVEMFGDPVQNSKSWPTAKLGSLIRKMGSGATPAGGDAAYKPFGISLIRSMNVHDGEFVRRNLAFIDEQQAQKLQNVVVEAGDVLLNITGASVARVCRAPADVLPARVNQHVMIIRPSDELNPLFLERMLLNSSMKEHLLKVGGAGATREAITKAEAEGLTVIVPPKNAQQDFAQRMNEVAKLVATCKSSSSELEALFGSLQQIAFSGEL